MSVSPAASRPFRILGLQQVALGALDRGRLVHLWCELLGVPHVGSYCSQSENVEEDLLELGAGAGRVEIDLMQPLDPRRSPRVHEPALNHIGLWVDDLAAAYAHLRAAGVRFAPGGIRQGASGHDVCFIHPKSSSAEPFSGEGVLIELVQAPADVREALTPKG